MTDFRLHALLPALLAIFCLAYAFHMAAADVRIAVEGARTQFEPGHIRLRVTVQPDKANRGRLGSANERKGQYL